MKKIKDRVLLGIVSGLIAAIPGRLLNTAEYSAGLTDAKYSHMAASLFTNKENSDLGQLLGSVANEAMVTTTGVAITYTLSATGRDSAVIKGIGVGTMYWFGLYGLTSALGILPKSKKPLSPLLGFVDHIIFGASCGLIASKLGDDSLFPDNEIKTPEDKLPLISH